MVVTTMASTTQLEGTIHAAVQPADVAKRSGAGSGVVDAQIPSNADVGPAKTITDHRWQTAAETTPVTSINEAAERSAASTSANCAGDGVSPNRCADRMTAPKMAQATPGRDKRRINHGVLQ